MGYVRHHAIVVTSWKRGALEIAHDAAPEPKTPIVAGVVEQYWSFAVLPDGSKEEWGDSLEGNQRREAFKEWMQTQAYEDGSSWLEWVEVEFGWDGNSAFVTDSPFKSEGEVE